MNNTALVLAAYGKDSLIEFNGQQINTTARQISEKIVVGDIVEFDENVITKILPRKNLLSNNGKNIVSNINEIFLTLAIKPYPQLSSIDNYLLKAKISNIKISILINKIDIVDSKHVDLIAKIYTSIGYNVNFISVEKQINLNILLQKTQNKTCVFVGQSGVGKSSIVNFLAKKKQKIAILGKDGLGKHTTNSSMIFTLSNNGKIIDTPGVREFNPSDFTVVEVKDGFIEFKKLAYKCKFNNCLHINEPKCEVKKQLNYGNISKYRYQNYCNLLDDTFNL